LTKAVKLYGRALSKVGAITTADMNAVANTIPGNCATVGISTLDANTTEAVIIYPNPFTSSIDIILNDAWQTNNAELNLYNVLGEQVMNVTVTKQLNTIGTSHLPNGIYFYKVIGNNKIIQSGRLVSQQ
ncbi:MAG: T9SS type A sorting domain-containing protein, partial [Bacteroidetes bacterium]|nr:T9SS type A sorting domain-containing protein [Bacteroidota bacterium]